MSFCLSTDAWGGTTYVCIPDVDHSIPRVRPNLFAHCRGAKDLALVVVTQVLETVELL